MIWIYYFSKPLFWVIPWILQSIGYYRLLRKLDQDGRPAIVPFIAEGKLSKIYFEKMSSYWHPLIYSGLFLGVGMYFRIRGATASVTLYGVLFTLLALCVYGTFLIRLYWRICKSFKKNIFFYLGMLCLPFVFLLFLSGKRSKFYGGPVFKIKLIHNRFIQWLFVAVRELIWLGGVGVVGLGMIFIVARVHMPSVFVNLLMEERYSKIAALEVTDTSVKREDVLAQRNLSLDQFAPGREHFYPDHSGDQDIVVMEYIVGSNLEDMQGLASFNIRQMIDATKKGPHLKFVIQAGGSARWFTNGIEEKTNGYYLIENGKLTKLELLDNTVAMTEPDQMYNFITYVKKNYPADRYMLAMWDHGGGLSLGFGQDLLNKRTDAGSEGNDYGTMLVSEIVDVLKRANVKFDVIGFDACLMQDIEVAAALEPYADYLLASEEVESGLGWYYTTAFSALAEDPTLSSEEFGRLMVSSFDVYNQKSNDDKPDSNSTLSLVDLTRIKPAFDSLQNLYDAQDAAIKAGSAQYADIASAVSNSYTFNNKEQVDMIGYLQNLAAADYDESVVADQELNNLIDLVDAAIVCRNANSAEGINGLALTFPHKMINVYELDHRQYEALGMDRAKNFYDDYFSIMATTRSGNDEVEFLGIALKDEHDYTKEEWYVSGFEGYDNTPQIGEIPLITVDGGWELQLPDSVWNIMADSQQIVYQKSEQGWRYLGHDVPGALDADNHPMISNDGTWIHINGQLVAYEADTAVKTEQGVVYKGTVKAKVDGEEVILYIEWDPITDETGVEVEGHVVGYRSTASETPFMEKGLEEIKPGQTVEFLFDYYDENGKLLKTEPYGPKLRPSSMAAMKVTDKKLGECDLRYGITITDVYERQFVTEYVEAHIEK